ncbi:uncharacterized protein LOC132311893 [Cornus florida]|uniref:uncharacterized protein LOC132311893 n=1 Tax=Cornus florida TaxID=4283 RepID=UPI00289CFEB8|nr:uncharacterized protein LOC132311893 [Cornus florida]
MRRGINDKCHVDSLIPAFQITIPISFLLLPSLRIFSLQTTHPTPLSLSTKTQTSLVLSPHLLNNTALSLSLEQSFSLSRSLLPWWWQSSLLHTPKLVFTLHSSTIYLLVSQIAELVSLFDASLKLELPEWFAPLHPSTYHQITEDAGILAVYRGRGSSTSKTKICMEHDMEPDAAVQRRSSGGVWRRIAG